MEVDREDGGGNGAKEGDRPMAKGYGCRSHLLGHLVNPRGGAVTQVRTPWVPHDLLRQALERSDAWRRAEGEDKGGGASNGEIISVSIGVDNQKEMCGEDG